MKKPHAWEHRPRVIPWVYCKHCGLVRLKTPSTYRAERASCADDLWRKE